jgi:hypothetical protein
MKSLRKLQIIEERTFGISLDGYMELCEQYSHSKTEEV